MVQTLTELVMVVLLVDFVSAQSLLQPQQKELEFMVMEQLELEVLIEIVHLQLVILLAQYSFLMIHNHQLLVLVEK